VPTPSTPSTSSTSSPPPSASLASLLRIVWRRRRHERSSRWSRERLERHQAESLARLRRFVDERSPFYRHFHRGLGNAPLEALPILDKATLMAHFDELVTDRSLRLQDLERHLADPAAPALYRDRYTVLSTSGSTGRRGVFVFNRDEWRDALAAILRPLAWNGAPPSWRRPRPAIITSTAPWHYSARVGRDLSSPLAPTLRLDAGTPLDELVARLNDGQPDSLAAYPSVLLQLADEQLAGRLHLALRHVGTSAERLPAETRRRVRAAWGIEVHDTYGATEYAPIATECEHGRMHLLEDRAILEVVDHRGRPVPPGEPGERLLLTVLDRRTQPLLRYELSDGVREQPGTCPCGRPFRMLAGVEGRLEESLRFPGLAGPEVSIHPNVFHDLLERVPASGWQVIQDERGALVVTLTGTPTAGVAEQLRQAVSGTLHHLGATVPTVEVRWADALRRGASGKAPLIASRRVAGATSA
jgi:phenylacetate-coenzyme A ligase PaaK-like adenylate-forming protein